MLTICKITSATAGYEAFNNFCLIRDAKKYVVGRLNVSKVLNRFEDHNGRDHFVVTPILDQPVTEINYDLALKICNGTRTGIVSLLGDDCPDDLSHVLETAKNNPQYSIYDADEYDRELYLEAVQSYLAHLVGC